MDEKIIQIKDKEYILVPSFANLKKLELRTKERFMKTAHRITVQDYGPDDIATILYCLIDVDPKERPNYEEFAEAVFQHGFMALTSVVSEIFVDIISAGQKEHDGSKK